MHAPFYVQLAEDRRAEIVLRGISLISGMTTLTKKTLSRGEIKLIVDSLKDFTTRLEQAYEEA
jgi:hypothetical protein